MDAQKKGRFIAVVCTLCVAGFLVIYAPGLFSTQAASNAAPPNNANQQSTTDQTKKKASEQVNAKNTPTPDQQQIINTAKELQAAIQKDPTNTQPYLDLGRLLMSIQLNDDAAAILYQALVQNPNLFEAHYNLGAIYAGAGNLEMAIEHFKDAVRIDPSREDAKKHLAHITKVHEQDLKKAQ